MQFASVRVQGGRKIKAGAGHTHSAVVERTLHHRLESLRTTKKNLSVNSRCSSRDSDPKPPRRSASVRDEQGVRGDGATALKCVHFFFGGGGNTLGGVEPMIRKTADSLAIG